MGDYLPDSAERFLFVIIGAGAAFVVLLGALATALILYQRRFVRVHRAHAEGLLQAQDQERAWVAQEVHDDVLQRIMLLQHELDVWAADEPTRPASSPDRVGALRAELEDLSAVLRRMAYRLHPAFVAQEGIVAMLERLAGDVDRAAGIRVEVRDGAHPVPILTADQALVVYRIAQEALSNVVRHAASPYAVVEVTAAAHSLELMVEDYGRGFNVGAARRDGLGLLSMSERARTAGGILSVASHPGGGTRVHLKLPVGGEG